MAIIIQDASFFDRFENRSCLCVCIWEIKFIECISLQLATLFVLIRSITIYCNIVVCFSLFLLCFLCYFIIDCISLKCMRTKLYNQFSRKRNLLYKNFHSLFYLKYINDYNKYTYLYYFIFISYYKLYFKNFMDY